MYGYLGFLSYKRDPEMDIWHDQVRRKLETYIRMEIGAPNNVRIYQDRSEIRSGQEWERSLTQGLALSPVLFAVFSGAYFASEWCVAELRTFMEREDRLGLPRGTLIKAAAVCGCSGFPEWVNAIQYDNFADEFVPGSAYWETDKSVDFMQGKLKRFATHSCELIRQMPEYSDEFPRLNKPEEQAITQFRPVLMPFQHLAA
ncbi:MAG: TIR domain-containing protein [Pikeienuella sp.]